jgi:transcriptional regulator with XRE-family HTH domain
MVIAAHFEPTPGNGGKPRPHRRRLQLEVAGSLASGDATAVLIHNISATGLLLETETRLTDGERIDIELPDAGSTAARIVWTSDRFYGGRFDTPLSVAVLSALELRSTAVPSKPSEPEETLASRLHRLRKAKGMTLAEVAQLLGVSKPTVWAWEQGRVRPAPERHAKIAALFGEGETKLVTGRDIAALGNALANARQQVAEMFGVETTKVRIMIEL